MKETDNSDLEQKGASDQSTGSSKKLNHYSSPQLIKYGAVSSVTGTKSGSSYDNMFATNSEPN